MTPYLSDVVQQHRCLNITNIRKTLDALARENEKAHKLWAVKNTFVRFVEAFLEEKDMTHLGHFSGTFLFGKLLSKTKAFGNDLRQKENLSILSDCLRCEGYLLCDVSIYRRLAWRRIRYQCSWKCFPSSAGTCGKEMPCINGWRKLDTSNLHNQHREYLDVVRLAGDGPTMGSTSQQPGSSGSQR